VVLEQNTTTERRTFLLAHDTDPFNKWEAGRELARELLCTMSGAGGAPDRRYLDALGAVVRDGSLDPAFRALVLAMPAEDELAKALHDRGQTPDPAAIHNARQRLALAIAEALKPDLNALYASMATPGPYDPNADHAGKRALQGAALAYLTKVDGGAMARAQFKTADNMTSQLSALTSLLAIDAGHDETAAFYNQWQANPLVIDKWFTLQISHASPEKTVATAKTLADHKDFDWQNPNRFRALIAGFSMMNQAGFHDPSGEGYAFLADWLIQLDPVNAQTTARMVSAFDGWRWYDDARQNLMRAQLARIATVSTLSTDTGEMVERILKG